MGIDSKELRAAGVKLPGDPAPTTPRAKRGTGKVGKAKREACAIITAHSFALDQYLDVVLPIRTVSEANVKGGERWQQHARTKQNRAATRLMLRRFPRPPLPVVVTLTRHGKRKLDEGDNLPRSMKAIRDGIADLYGIDDADPSVMRFKYAQEFPRDYAVRIRIEHFPLADGAGARAEKANK